MLSASLRVEVMIFAGRGDSPTWSSVSSVVFDGQHTTYDRRNFVEVWGKDNTS